MKIALIGQKGIPATYGGVENYVEEVSARLVEKGHRVTVYCRNYYTPPRAFHRGVRLERLPSLRTKHLDAVSHTFLAVLNSLVADYDIVNFQALGPASLSFISRLAGRAKVVVTIHTLDYKREKWGRVAKTLLRAAEYPALYCAHGVTVVSRTLQQYFEDRYGVHVDLVPTPAAQPRFREPRRINSYGLEKNNFILYLGRLVPEKGCHYLIEAFERLDTKMKLFIAGGGRFSDGYVRQLRTHQSDRIVFGGHVDTEVMLELYSNAYLYVLPSELEGRPQTLLDALAYGRAVLVSDIPENLEIAQRWGFTFRNKDVNDLTTMLAQLVESPERVAQHEKQRREYARNAFSWEKTVALLEAVFEHCLRPGIEDNNAS